MYTFKKIGTEEYYDDLVKSSELDTYMVEHSVERVLSAPRIVGGIDAKPDNGFRDVLKRIKSANRRSTIETF